MTDSDAPASGNEAKATKLPVRVRRGPGRPARVREETHEPAREPTGRAERVPLGVQRLKGTASKRPGYVRRWVNDDGVRIQDAIRGGYDFVTKDEKAQTTNIGEAKSQVAGRKESGAPLIRYLMEIREEWYAEDQATKQEPVNATEMQIRRGELVGKVGQDGVYIPSRGISIKRAG